MATMARPVPKWRPIRWVGRFLVIALSLLATLGTAAPGNIDQLLQRADQIKYTHNDEYLTLLKQLDALSDNLTTQQRDWLAYFHAWQLGYSGAYEKALAAFQALLAHTHDPTVRARSRISLVYDQVNSGHLDDAYTVIGDLLESLPQIEDHNTHFLILGTAATLYGSAGQYDLALSYTEQMLAYDDSDRSVWFALSSQVDILQYSAKLHATDAAIRRGIDACERFGDLLYANSIRIDVAISLVDQGQGAEALKLLEPHEAEVLASNSATTISEFDSALARAYFAVADIDRARTAARSAIDRANSQVNAKSVANAYNVLYEVAKKQGDDKAALAYHEKYAAADKGYLNDISARALAFQMVHQRVLDSQRQLESVNDANKVLTLKQQVEAQKSRARLLYMLLLFSGLLIVGGWAYRTKRSQLKFQKLARIDSLTGIFNRQHFFDSAQDALRYCARSGRPVSLLAMDLDHFKSVNDMHGHAAGDAALQSAVAACQVRLRTIDLFGRLGGEEFAILLPDCPLAIATQRAEEMRKAIPASRDGITPDILVTASFGVASTQACGYNLATMLAHADNALYDAKRGGRNRVQTHAPAESSATT